MVEGARLESVYRSKAYRGFESRPLRNKCMMKIRVTGFFHLYPSMNQNEVLGEWKGINEKIA